MAKFGLDFESVRLDNPGIVYASISGFGSDTGRTCRATTCWCRRCRG